MIFDTMILGSDPGHWEIFKITHIIAHVFRTLLSSQ